MTRRDRDDGPPQQLAPVKVHNSPQKSELLSPNILRLNLWSAPKLFSPTFFCQAHYILQSVAADCLLKKNMSNATEMSMWEIRVHDIFGGTLTDDELGFLKASLNEQLTSITRCILQRSVGSEFLDSPFACLSLLPASLFARWVGPLATESCADVVLD